MKYLFYSFIFTFLLFLSGCNSDDSATESITYELPATSEDNISGTLVISENDDKSATFTISLNNTIKGFQYPAHLHYGDLNVADADIARMLNPVSGDDGKSETIISRLSDDSPVTYEDILSGEYSLKVHLGDDAESKKVILTATNIGGSGKIEAGSGKIAVCGSKEKERY